MKPSIYMAGKIGPTDWRTELFNYRFGSQFDRESVGPDGIHSFEVALGTSNLFDPGLRLDCGSFFYTGPFFVSCDHSCFHGPASHGAGARDGGCDFDLSNPVKAERHRHEIFEINRKRLTAATHVFAYIDDPSCHGTLIELGMAHQMGKQIAVCMSMDLSHEDEDDLWMARMCAPRGSTCYGTAYWCWDWFARVNGFNPKPSQMKAIGRRHPKAGLVWR